MLMAVVDFPTPPLPLATAIIFFAGLNGTLVLELFKFILCEVKIISTFLMLVIAYNFS